MSNLISVPREHLEVLLHPEPGTLERYEAALHELHALLAKPADPKPTGLSQGWNLTRKHDGFVVGHQSVAYPPDEKAIERAKRDGYVWVPFLVPAEQPAPIPEGYCIMPRHLTAENGAKALLLGEFKLQSTHECPECRELEEPSEGCEICDGEGEYGQKHTIPWDLIKFIYSKAVEGLAVKAEPAKS